MYKMHVWSSDRRDGMGGLVEWVDGWVGYVYRNGKVVR